MSTETENETQGKAPEFTFNPKTEVLINHAPTSKYDKKKLSDLVNQSGINHEHKLKIWAQIKEGQIKPQYHETIQSILVANSQGSVYMPGTAGY